MSRQNHLMASNSSSRPSIQDAAQRAHNLARMIRYRTRQSARGSTNAMGNNASTMWKASEEHRDILGLDPIVKKTLNRLTDLFKRTVQTDMGPAVIRVAPCYNEEIRNTDNYSPDHPDAQTLFESLIGYTTFYTVEVDETRSEERRQQSLKAYSHLQDALLLRNCCSSAAYTLKDIISVILRHQIKMITWKRVVPRPKLVMFFKRVEESQEIIAYSHDILMLETHDGHQYAYDPTGPQFGQNLLVVEWQEYLENHTMGGQSASVVSRDYERDCDEREIYIKHLLLQRWHRHEETTGVSNISTLSNAELDAHFDEFMEETEKAL